MRRTRGSSDDWYYGYVDVADIVDNLTAAAGERVFHSLVLQFDKGENGGADGPAVCGFQTLGTSGGL